MSRTLEKIDIGGQTIWIETDAVTPATHNLTIGKYANTDATGATQRTVDIIEEVDIDTTIRSVVDKVHGALLAAGGAIKPDEFAIDFSLGLKAGVGAFIASGEINAQIKVSAKWKLA